MNSNYEQLPVETRSVIEKAIDRVINTPLIEQYLEEPEKFFFWIVPTLLLTIIENDENFQNFLNGFYSGFVDELKNNNFMYMQHYGQAHVQAKSTNYVEDYYRYRFESLVRSIIGYLDEFKMNFKRYHSNEELNINFLSPNIIAYVLLNSEFVQKEFNDLEKKRKGISDFEKIEDPLCLKFKDFLYEEAIKEKSITFTGNKKIVEEAAKTSSIIDNPQEMQKMLNLIEEKFIGQEEAAKLLLLSIIKNQKAANIQDFHNRSIIFVDGPSGTGKTAIVKDITDSLGVPFVATSITSYSATGYVGGNITDILKELFIKSNGDLDKAQRGIVVLDEFDKIVNSGSMNLDMRTAVQHQLLDFLGGGVYTIKVEEGKTVDFDTSKLTFVCLGALTNLRNSKMQMASKRPIGFNAKYDEAKLAKDYSITPEDLIKMGFEKELVGRFNTYVHTRDYSKEDLKKILLESKISPLIGFTTLASSLGKKLLIDDGVYELIAEAAYDLNTGARSLQTVVNNLNSQYLEELLMGVEDEIHITTEDVKRITDGAFKEKGRH